MNCDGKGPISAEWMVPKALWIRQNEPQIWEAAKTICEYQDYINYRLSGIMCASSCNTASRWHWDGEKCIQADDNISGRPISMYRKLGIPELAEKQPSRCIPMGALVGNLTAEARDHLGLTQCIPVIQGGPDAFVGMIGLGCIHAGQLCLITGSSHLHCVVTSHPTTAVGTWGAYRGAPLPGLNFAEGGQSSTGSIIRWARNLFGGDVSYKLLDDEASIIAPGADGLVALETFQGSRTPITDPLAKGAVIGLTLSHTRAHIWRALMEAVCFGTRACIEGLGKAGHTCDEIILAGGITRSPLWLQMHADVTGKPVIVCENTDAPLLGCAILASVGVGIHISVQDAVRSMVRTREKIAPNEDMYHRYDDIYRSIYNKLTDAARPISHSIFGLRGGSSKENTDLRSLTGDGDDARHSVTPSLLACDWSEMKEEIHRCMDAGATRFHVDVFDGVFLDSPYALTFGPSIVEAIRRSCDLFGSTERACLDLHVCVQQPSRYVQALADAGGDHFIFQWEAVDGFVEALSLKRLIVASGMKCGISINPSTDVDEILPLLETDHVSIVDILAVEPGFGGQCFQSIALAKIKRLRKWRDDCGKSFDIMVDGGINKDTAAEVIKAGATILVAGTSIFKHSEGVKTGYSVLRDINV